MNQKELLELTDQELLLEAKNSKRTKVYDAVIFGVLIGIAIYSSIKNGFGLLTFLPLVYIPIAAKNKTKNTALESLLKERNLK
ncbi:FUSC family protein [Cryomorpha ignava]|uniref:FUSC family protein n=1 Tax=Cryomorpha ignava TaxID=101383 RepID=A0A7K3WL58_9FLAO|nr:FUSC family protein [Cryomorpha ignava]NEN22369.1 FUSC family protein [Cryomorpha ignava]